MTRLTSALLRAHDACSKQVAVFEKVFPEGAPLTKAAFRRADAAGLDVWWCGELLSPSANAAYDAARASAGAAYDAAIAPAGAAYDAARASANAAYDAAIAPAWAAYDAARASALLAALRQAVKGGACSAPNGH